LLLHPTGIDIISLLSMQVARNPARAALVFILSFSSFPGPRVVSLRGNRRSGYLCRVSTHTRRPGGVNDTPRAARLQSRERNRWWSDFRESMISPLRWGLSVACCSVTTRPSSTGLWSDFHLLSWWKTLPITVDYAQLW
jgi:hypothetical protein